MTDEPLPEGFTLDQEPEDGLPPGFTLDTAQEAPPMPTMGEVAAYAVPRGVANLLNTPSTIKSLMEKGLAKIPYAEALFPGVTKRAANPTNTPARVMEKMGLIDPTKAPQTQAQRIVDMAIQAGVGTAVAPATGIVGIAKNIALGTVSGAAAQTTKEATGSDLLAAAVGIATPMAISGIRAAPVSPSLTTEGRDIFTRARAEGLVVQPSRLEPTIFANKMESLAGKASVNQAASIKNAPTFRDLAARAVGLQTGENLSHEVLDAVAERAAAPYREIAEISPRAATALEKLKQLRFDAGDWMDYYRKQGNPIARTKATRLYSAAEQQERIIEQEANALIKVYGVNPASPARPTSSVPSRSQIAEGTAPLQLETRMVDQPSAGTTRPTISEAAGPETLDATFQYFRSQGASDILDRLRAARKLIARTHDIERAMNIDGNISAQTLRTMQKNGRPLSGELKLIADFAGSFPHAAQDAWRVQSPGVSSTKLLASGAIGAIGGLSSGPAGALVGLLPFADYPARALMLSKGYQSRLLQPVTPFGETLYKGAMVAKTLQDYKETSLDPTSPRPMSMRP